MKKLHKAFFIFGLSYTLGILPLVAAKCNTSNSSSTIKTDGESNKNKDQSNSNINNNQNDNNSINSGTQSNPQTDSTPSMNGENEGKSGTTERPMNDQPNSKAEAELSHKNEKSKTEGEKELKGEKPENESSPGASETAGNETPRNGMTISDKPSPHSGSESSNDGEITAPEGNTNLEGGSMSDKGSQSSPKSSDAKPNDRNSTHNEDSYRGNEEMSDEARGTINDETSRSEPIEGNKGSADSEKKLGTIYELFQKYNNIEEHLNKPESISQLSDEADSISKQLISNDTEFLKTLGLSHDDITDIFDLLDSASRIGIPTNLEIEKGNFTKLFEKVKTKVNETYSKYKEKSK
ncbi:Hypothetical protein, predicted lipoprotein [Metamycoplasma auris 15026]|uniref:Uncharacterized protein n=1 Tax=Metamycoplasma auris 15026 TaxID=1188233 RepID=N9VC78_9BACT|nr:variable surface lipoprotein [Metamycoplasma auris]ENY69283.1 Hypothetical protein, predicted lipoprotein [Metamycoplasma auris 15026]